MDDQDKHAGETGELGVTPLTVKMEGFEAVRRWMEIEGTNVG